MKRDTRTAYRTRAAATERTVDEAMAQVKAALDADAATATKRYAALTKPVPFTPEDLGAARIVRTMYGWERVIRVNAKTVTVLGSFGEYRVPITTLLEVR